MDGEQLDSLALYDVDTCLSLDYNPMSNDYLWLRTRSTDNSARYWYLDESQYLQSEIDANGIISIRNAAGETICYIDFSNVDNIALEQYPEGKCAVNLESLMGFLKSTSDVELPDVDEEAFIKVLDGGSYESKR